jgi:predicted nucleic acid-binding protein
MSYWFVSNVFRASSLSRVSSGDDSRQRNSLASAMRVRKLTDLFADSYALVALLEGNERYIHIFRRKTLVTSALNVLEVYATLLRRLDRKEARELSSGFLPIAVPVPPEVALAAVEFRHHIRSKKRDCSYVDAWGYASARHLQVPFLTGDPAFQGVEHVEFVR